MDKKIISLVVLNNLLPFVFFYFYKIDFLNILFFFWIELMVLGVFAIIEIFFCRDGLFKKIFFAVVSTLYLFVGGFGLLVYIDKVPGLDIHVWLFYLLLQSLFLNLFPFYNKLKVNKSKAKNKRQKKIKPYEASDEMRRLVGTLAFRVFIGGALTGVLIELGGGFLAMYVLLIIKVLTDYRYRAKVKNKTNT